ncbi:MAG TPA: ATP-grasp domain-containing protein [Myxococcota bacterium]|nr:ATP-grasp domain-containing protein [Myxococcota bacterium]HRY94405.1 ATP-grasp domain-containing protein [Myxococcota bacterium]HSA22469.1 ATP-grasp domain-containing protein [Myxococcota bacterium]
MSHSHDRRDLPVLLLHNVDASWSAPEQEEATRLAGALAAALGAIGHPVTNLPVTHADLRAQLAAYDPAAWVVLNWCEGLPGVPHSEAQVVEALEELGFCYTGSPPEVLALTWSKPQVKERLEAQGVPTPPWRVLTPEVAADAWTAFPAIVKPAAEHCSLGVTPEAVVLTVEELRRRVEHVHATYGQPALVEEFIDGREYHVTVWGNGVVRCLPPAEIDFSEATDIHDRLCTFDSKFNPGSWHFEHLHVRVPAPLERAEQQRLERTAIRAYRALGCRDYARLDLRLRDGDFHVLDVNPNPDISPDTSMALGAGLLGLDYGAAISRLVNLAAARHPVLGRCTSRLLAAPATARPTRVVLAATRRKPAARTSRPRLARTAGRS